MAPYHLRITTSLITFFAADGEGVTTCTDGSSASCAAPGRALVQMKLRTSKGSKLLTQEQRDDTERRMTADCQDACKCNGHEKEGGTCTMYGHTKMWCYTDEGACPNSQKGRPKNRWSEEPCKATPTPPTPTPSTAPVYCSDTESLSGNGADYRGCQKVTRSGYTCQRWDVQSPHKHGVTSTKYPDKGIGAHENCRNPDGEATIWCYTTSTSKRWELCDPLPTEAPAPTPAPPQSAAPTPTPPSPAPTPKPTPAPGADCQDLVAHCSSWQASGYCTQTYVSYMKVNCKASCGLCATAQPTPTPPTPTPPTPPADFPECGVLSETWDRAKTVNVVLVGSKFGQDETHWKTQVDWIYGKFDAYTPLQADVIEQLNVYYVRTPVPGDNGAKCWYGCQGIDRLLCCDGAFFERHVTGKCGAGLKYQIIVVHNDKKHGGAGGRIGTTSIASSAPLIAIHELGHSMFELGDEYSYSVSHRDYANCDRSAGCPKWADMIGQFEGVTCSPDSCGGGEYNAPGSNTLMKSLSSNAKLGAVNERITCCKYKLETDSYPEYCKPFDSGNFDLKSYCETYVWKRQVNFLENGEEVVVGMAQGIHYVHVEEPVEWELMKTNKGEWRCAKLGNVPAGQYPRDEVEGDLEPPRAGDRIVVEVLAEDGAGELTVLRKLSFNEFDAVEIPPHMEGEPDDEAGSEASEERSDINVILNQGETCRIARQP